MIRTILRALAALLGLGAAPAVASGFQQVAIRMPGDAPLAVGIWYPSDTPAESHAVGAHTAMLAVNGALRGAALPLVVMSHGSGGSFASLYTTGMALAEAGFVVAAVTHTGDTHQNHSRKLEVIDRPAQMTRLIDYMLEEWPLRSAIDAARVGIVGYSVGAFTALVSIGGTPDLRRIVPHCEANPHDPICRIVGEHAADAYEMNDGGGKTWSHDPRIKAAVLAAPALAFVFGRDGLAGVRAPIQLWRGEVDQTLPEPSYAEALLRDLPVKPEYHVVPRGNHLAFLAPCGWAMAASHPGMCRDAAGFDRAAFNREFNAEILRFFRTQFAATP